LGQQESTFLPLFFLIAEEIPLNSMLMMEKQEKENPASSPSNLKSQNGDGHHENNSEGKADDDKSSLTAAADLIRTLDTAFAEMSTLSASAARDAEDARRNARAASEVARRYTARSYPTGASVFGTENSSVTTGRFDADASATKMNGNIHFGTSTTENGTEFQIVPSNDRPPIVDENDESAVVNYDFNTAGSSQPPKAVLAGRKRKSSIPSSSERLAQSHAEDVLSLSLELERTKQALENEQRRHDETRASLTESRCQNTQIENQIQKLLNDMETQREDHGRQVDTLEQELKRAQVRVDAAEEDAQLALELAKGSADSREQVEEWLQRALQEVQMLREQLEHVGVDPNTVVPPSPPRRKSSVRFAESPTIFSPENIIFEDQQIAEDFELTPRSQASRPMVAAGRQLLKRAKPLSEREGDSALHSVSYRPGKSSECRHKLRERLQAINEDDDAFVASRNVAKREAHSPGEVHGIDMTLATEAIESTRNIANQLKESAKRLGLGGHCWNTSLAKGPSEDNVESLARQYCQSVEVRCAR
jgi:hypothetical protein